MYTVQAIYNNLDKKLDLFMALCVPQAFCRVSKPACFGAAPAPRIFFPEPAPAPVDKAFFHNFEGLKYVQNNCSNTCIYSC